MKKYHLFSSPPHLPSPFFSYLPLLPFLFKHILYCIFAFFWHVCLCIWACVAVTQNTTVGQPCPSNTWILVTKFSTLGLDPSCCFLLSHLAGSPFLLLRWGSYLAWPRTHSIAQAGLELPVLFVSAFPVLGLEKEHYHGLRKSPGCCANGWVCGSGRAWSLPKA